MNKSKSAKGVMGELTIAAKYIRKGYYVAMAMCPHSPFDLVVVDGKGNCKLIDAKTVSIRKSGKQTGQRINRMQSKKQQEMNIEIEYVDPETTI
jgi:hypothetical protein|tara:strand:+ start:1148 stop:1429 length:282 start_codon:yes stop_codon:yes gene_type:complete